MNRSGKLILAVVIALASYLGYCMKQQTNPITGEVQHISITPADEVAIGLNSAPEMMAQFGGELPNEKVQALLDKVGNKLIQNSLASKSEYQFDFHVLADDQTINAFALPGGQIFITLGLLKRLSTEDQLAGVIGHEIGHVIGRHGAEHMAKQELTQGLVGAAQVATADPNNPNGSAQIAAFVGNMIDLKYGREDELESDNFGVQFLLSAGYEPNAMIEVMQILKEASNGQSQPEFMSSHPSPENRIEKLKEAIAYYKIQNKNQ